MARIRSVKPEFWTDGVMVGLTVWARLFYIGSWNFACDRGHLPDDPMSLKLKILPADQVDVAELIAELVAAGRIERRATRDGRSYLTIRRFMDHQKLDPRWTSKCPYCAAEAEGAPPPPPPTPLPPDPPHETHPNSGEAQRDSPEPPEPQPRIGRDRSGGDRRGEDVPPTAGASLALVPPLDEPLDGDIVEGHNQSEEPIDSGGPGEGGPRTAQTLVREWIDHCAKKPPRRVVGHVARQLGELLGEGVAYDDVRAGLAAWWRKGSNPSALPSFVNQAMNAQALVPARAAPRTSGDIDWDAAMARAVAKERR